jgi:cytochrome c-type biogenesis protein CcmH/NrfG
MNPHDHSKLNQRQRPKEQSAAAYADSQAAQSTALEFASPEEMLRHDSAQLQVPDRVIERLQESIRQEPPRPKGWLRRLFGG